MDFDPSRLEVLLAQQIAALDTLKEDVEEIKGFIRGIDDRLREVEGWQRESNGAKQGRAGVQYLVYVYATVIAAAAALLAWWKA